MSEFHMSSRWYQLPPKRLRDAKWSRRLPYRWRRGQHFKLWNCFSGYDRREGRYWGFGILQIGKRHLLAAIRNNEHPHTRIWIGFIQFGRPTHD